MKILSFVFAAALLTAAAPVPQSKSYTGTVTDTMCKRDHKPMNVAPDDKCVKECVGDGKTYKYALLVGTEIYTLSDQETPATFAGRRVVVTGVLYEKTKILKVESIEAAR